MVPPLFYVTSASCNSCLSTSTGYHTADLLGAPMFFSLLPRDVRWLNVGENALHPAAVGLELVSLQLSFSFID